jgi:hypothetical protein
LKGSCRVVRGDEEVEAFPIQTGREERGAQVVADIGQREAPSGQPRGNVGRLETDAPEGAHLACIGHGRVTLYHVSGWIQVVL